MHKRSFRIILLGVFTITARLLYAQQPVQVNTLLRPPYTLQLSNYYASTQEKLILILTNRDLNKPILNVRLRMTIESQTVQLRSRDFATLPTLQLEAGVPLRLSLGDLAPYFNTENLDFSGITRAQYAQQAQLPEGFYQFCFEAIEISTGLVASAKNCAMVWISLSDPPLLNLPTKDEAIAQKEPQNIIFQWTPRHLNSPNSAFATEYDFQLVELWDNTLAPEVAFQSMQPLYEATTRTTTLLYGPSQPLLIVGKRYGWRVRARAKSGVEDVDVFRNQGFSEIYWFTYKEMCPAPAGINATIATFGNIQLSWAPATKHTDYKVMYRQKDKANATWFDQTSSSPLALIYDVQPGVEYEYQVGAYCATDQLVFSDVNTIKIPLRTSDTFANCRIVPTPNITNKQILQQLKTGDVITAGDFPVRITEVFGSATFSGKGYVTVPFLGRAKVRVNFWNIQVNTTNQLVAGKIVTTYDVGEGSIADTDEAIDIFQDYKGIVSRLQGFTADVDRDDLMNILDKLVDKAEKELPTAVDEIKKNVAALVDAKDTYDQIKATYDALPDGDPLKISLKKELDEAAQKFDDIKNRFEGKDKNAVTTQEHTVEFIANKSDLSATRTTYGFDSYREHLRQENYEVIKLSEGNKKYFVPWKAVPLGGYDWVTVLPTQLEAVPPENIIVKSDFAGPIEKIETPEGDLSIKINGYTEKDQIIAYEKKTIEGKEVNIEIGKLNVVSYPKLYRKLVLVQVNNTPLSYTREQIESELNRIYAQAVVEWSVDIKSLSSVYDVNMDGLDPRADYSAYSSEMKKIIYDLGRQGDYMYDRDVSYLFLVPDFGSGVDWAGVNPHLKQFGFIATKNLLDFDGYIHVVAHELGHGAFRLDHTFKSPSALPESPIDNFLPEGSTSNLMDYHTNGNELYKYQWDNIHKAAPVNLLFDGFELADEQSAEQDQHETETDSIQLSISYGNQKYKNKDVIFLPSDTTTISLKAIVDNDTTHVKQFSWKGVTSSKSDIASFSFSESTGGSTNVELSYGSETISVSIALLRVHFERLPEGTSGQTNRYGYDPMDNTNPDDDHISLVTGGETFVKLRTSSGNLEGILLKSDNDQIAEAVIDGENIKIIARGTNKQETQIKAFTVNDPTTAIATITVNVYDLVTVGGKIYSVYLQGDLTTKVSSGMGNYVKREANNYLKHLVVTIDKLDQGDRIPVAYDLNRNGKVDFYKNDEQHELDIIYKELVQKKNLRYNNIVRFKEPFIRNWTIMESVPRGSTYILVSSPALNKGFNMNADYGEYRLQSPNGDYAETFQIIGFDGDRVLITTSQDKAVLRGFSFDHPKTTSLVESHVIVSESATWGLGSRQGTNSPADDEPTLVCGAAVSSEIVAHELMHEQGLTDVNDYTNIMHHHSPDVRIGVQPFRYFGLDAVITGTSVIDPSKPKQEQWKIIKGR